MALGLEHLNCLHWRAPPSLMVKLVHNLWHCSEAFTDGFGTLRHASKHIIKNTLIHLKLEQLLRHGGDRIGPRNQSRQTALSQP
jgi:hypothetical protein